MFIYFYASNKIIKFSPNWSVIGKLIVIATILFAGDYVMREAGVFWMFGALITFLLYVGLLNIFRIFRIKDVNELLFSKNI